MTDGVLPVDKPPGPTSHDIVDLARRALGVRRVGHTGTLDPFASGLLLLCVGWTTRLSEYLTALDKTYEAVARLGIATGTDDLEGDVLAEADPAAVRSVDAAAVEAALTRLRGTILQVPPRFSAKKVGGVAMHRLARGGKPVTPEPRTVTVHDIGLTGWEPPCFGFRVRCSSGTYVRSLARDVGTALGVGAHLTRLRRTAIGAFQAAGALSPDDLASVERVDAARIDPLDALAHLPVVAVAHEDAGRLTHGREVRLDGMVAEGTVAVSSRGALLAVADVRDGVLRPRKVFGGG